MSEILAFYSALAIIGVSLYELYEIVKLRNQLRACRSVGLAYEKRIEQLLGDD